MIDDEPAIRRAVRRLLEGYFEVVAVDGLRAALKLIEGGATFDVVMTDLYGPWENGREILAKISQVAPQLATRFVVLTSGPVDAELSAWCATLGEHLLIKPPQRVQLVRALRLAMGASVDDEA